MKKILRFICVILVGLMVTALIVYNNASADGPEEEKRNIKVSVGNKEIGIGEETTLSFDFGETASSVVIYLSVNPPEGVTITGEHYTSDSNCINASNVSNISLTVKGNLAGACTIGVDQSKDEETKIEYDGGESYGAKNLDDLNVTITVKDPEELKPTIDKKTLDLKVGGGNGTIKASAEIDSWSSNNTGVATVKGVENDKRSAEVTPVGEGTATITGTTKSGQSVSVEVRVAPADKPDDSENPNLNYKSMDIKLGETGVINVTNNEAVTWQTSDSMTVSIIEQGDFQCTILGSKVGTATITATSKAHPEMSSSINVNVVEGSGEEVIPDNPKITSSQEITLTVGETSKASADQAVEWSSADTSVATVDSEGNIKAVGVGSTVIMAKGSGGGIAQIKVTVKAANNPENGGGTGNDNGSGGSESANSGGNSGSSGTSKESSTGSTQSTQKKSSSSANGPAPATGESAMGIVLVIGVITFIVAAVIFRKKGK